MAALPQVPRPAGLVLSPDDDVAVAVRAVVRFHLRTFERFHEEAVAGAVEPIHQLRVSTRRLRAAIRLFRPHLPRRFGETIDDELDWLGGAIGGVRDLDVLFDALHARAARLDPDLRQSLGPVGVAIHGQRAAALTALDHALADRRARRLLQRLATFAEAQTPPRRPTRLGDVAPGLTRALVRPVRRAGRRLAPSSPPADFHRLRVRLKRLRYGLETLRGLGGKPLRRCLDRLERLQDVLGASQDAVTQIAWLRSYAATPDVDAASLLPVGALMQGLARRAEKRRRRALKEWSRFESDGLLDDVGEDLTAEAEERRPPVETP
jgi:CHAD domain-containing protein